MRGEGQTPSNVGYPEAMAAWFERHAANSVCNAHYDRPAVLELLGDVTDLEVLDAGCGPGYYAEELVRRGAKVEAVDASEAMVDLARRRLPVDARVYQHDLNRPLDHSHDQSFDVVLSALVLGHLDNRVGFIAEAFRLLRPGGAFVVSTHHPICDWRAQGGSYFAVEQFEFTFSEGAFAAPHWRLPLSTMVDELLSPGFVLEKIVEPRPSPAVAEISPEEFELLATAPDFIAFRLRRPGEEQRVGS